MEKGRGKQMDIKDNENPEANTVLFTFLQISQLSMVSLMSDDRKEQGPLHPAHHITRFMYCMI